ncbi:MAG: SDR family oxidoreductase [Actinobacteria bacterium]|nr:MAG: SDR family oxidoreductase [Actinomycetota bacterium]
MTRYLVTGGAGFIGSNIVEELLRRGDSVRVLDNFSTGFRSNLNGMLQDIDLIEGDLRSYERVHNAVRGVEVVLHQGALPSVPRSIQDPLTTNAVNITGTLNVLLASRDEDVRRVVYASSSSVYGESVTLPKLEDMPLAPLAPYAVAKLGGEAYCQAFSRVYPLETVCLRYFNVFGPRQDPGSQYSAVIPKFVTRMLEGKAPVIYGDGEQSRDFTYVENVVSANILAASVDGVSGESFNVGCGTAVSLNETVDILNDILATSITPVYAPPREGEIRDSLADIRKADTLLGYEVKCDFHSGMRSVVDWYRRRMAEADAAAGTDRAAA